MSCQANKPKIGVLIVDPQRDFHEGGSLAVAGASADAVRLAALLRAVGGDITDILITLDSHHRNHIAHGISWINSETGQHPNPFTLISADEAEREVWRAVDSARSGAFKKYTRSLEERGKFQLCIWPEHCLIGTEGHAVVREVNEAVQEWSGRTGKNVEYVFKGQNVDVEMYSAMAAEVIVENDPSTHFNSALMQRLQECDLVLICGQALSHCVNFTTRDIVEEWKGDKSKLVLLTDCSSSVGGFEAAAQEFVTFCREAGMQVTDSAALEATWREQLLMIRRSGAKHHRTAASVGPAAASAKSVKHGTSSPKPEDILVLAKQSTVFRRLQDHHAAGEGHHGKQQYPPGAKTIQPRPPRPPHPHHPQSHEPRCHQGAGDLPGPPNKPAAWKF